MKANLVFFEIAAFPSGLVVLQGDAARSNDLTFVSIHTPHASCWGVRVSGGGQ